MKAWVLKAIGQFELEENIELPKIADDEVLLEIKAAGICGSDIQRVYENGAHKMPLIIGHEFAGRVCKVGNKVTNKWLDRRVGVFPLIPCKKCSSCLNKQYEMCSSYSYLGSRTDGGFAQYVAVPEWNLIELPDDVSFEQAAMLEPMAVAVHAIRHMDIDKNMSVAVCGLGTIGQLIIMFLQGMGVKKIFAIGSKNSHKLAANKLNISDDYYRDFAVSDCESIGDKIDIYFDCVGKNETILKGIELVKPGGQIALVGNPYSDITFDKNIYWNILRHQLTLKGTWNSSFYGSTDSDAYKDDWHYVLSQLSDNNLHPEILISHRYEIDDIINGFKIMKNKSEAYTKIIMVN